MTMPSLMNCAHSDTGWCLDCVRALYDRLEQKEADLEQTCSELMDANDTIEFLRNEADERVHKRILRKLWAENDARLSD